MSNPIKRFTLYIKAGSDGTCVGDCPFSQRAWLFMLIKRLKDQTTVATINILNKSDEFLKMNPKGKTPVLFDHKENKAVDDSEEICTYIDGLFPEPPVGCNFKETAADAATSKIFPSLCKMIMNKNTSETPILKQTLTNELVKVNAYLETSKYPFLTGDTLQAIDCAVLPKLLHVKVAGKAYKNYTIPNELESLAKYLENAEADPVFAETRPLDEEIICGWGRHDILKEL
ncbi:unnamed protein product [Owenia fusiformis]|uniref:GST N-terminal domain-containing protein n=1 Tax=Owenia fusiformis TaxID=6347 RepID=A0A8S4PWU2_OWEFU|nr:unnamed protein product [Owenia fusiformis]